MQSEEQLEYRVVVNHEGQYSIWPAYKERPRGWEDAGKRGSKQDCLSFIEEVWTDMRPRSLREQQPVALGDRDDVEPYALLERLCEGRHPLRVARADNAEDLQAQLRREHVHLLFTATDGQTELGFRPDPAATDTSEACFDEARGLIRLAGTLQVDFEPVQIVAELDLSTLHGTGGLIRANGASSH
jgi:uncharacterized protein YbdZ (MbtH family)